MKRLVGLTIAALILATPVMAQIVPGDHGTYPSVNVTNTPHNLNNYPGVTLPGNQVCLPCHTPHNALLNNSQVLWNHALTGETFAMYTSGTGQPDVPSKLCLSCHDGVTAIDSYGGAAGTAALVLSGGAALGADLTDDHPIGIAYPTALPSEYRDAGTFAPGIGGGPGVQLVSIGGVMRVECTSCHDVHNNGLNHFLRVPLEESYICLQCHIK